MDAYTDGVGAGWVDDGDKTTSEAEGHLPEGRDAVEGAEDWTCFGSVEGGETGGRAAASRGEEGGIQDDEK